MFPVTVRQGREIRPARRAVRDRGGRARPRLLGRPGARSDIRERQGHHQPGRLVRDAGTAPDGSFSPSSQFPQEKNRRVADVYLLLPWRPWEPQAARFLRMRNPFADRPLEDDVLPVAATFGVIKEEPGQLVLGWNPERGWF